MTNEAALKKKTKAIHEALLKMYGTPKWTKVDGVSELVSTILSQNTNDGNRDLAFDGCARDFQPGSGARRDRQKQ